MNAPLHSFAKFTALATFVLLIAGALVTSTGSGLAVPDWPLAFGKLFPRMVGGVLFEHGHRILASIVATLTFTLCLWILLAEKRAWVRRLGLAAFGAVVLQAILGGMTVLLRLPPTVSIAHAGLAELFFCLIVSLCVVTSRGWIQGSEEPLDPDQRLDPQDSLTLRTLAITAVAIVYVQILLGAVVRHTGTGVIPHIIGAAAVLFILGRLTFFINSGYSNLSLLRKPIMAATHLAGLQLILGFGAWALKMRDAGLAKPSAGKIWIATGHLALGALVLATCVLFAWRVFLVVRRQKLTAETVLR